MPLKYVDIVRITRTNLEHDKESRIEDIWTAPNADRALSSEWTGQTCFELLRPKPPPGHKWVGSRCTKVQKTTRPDNIWPETWVKMSKKEKNLAIAEWNIESSKRNEARNLRNLHHIPDDDIDTYNRVMAEKRQELKPPEAPAMPVADVNSSPACASRGGSRASADAGGDAAQEHQENIS